MFGLEPAAADAMELRRMYVDPSARRSGIARSMLQFAEAECRRLGMRKLELSTSELQPAALELYGHAGYRLLNEAVAEQASNKTLGRRHSPILLRKDVCRTKWPPLPTSSASRIR